mmetsp:Transcript_64654/g.173155  ORF Transcript_64654/g.173155 Transcript_64654/m.173155 type:complete len:205 (-) Transcript_64654:1614-2228(-)
MLCTARAWRKAARRSCMPSLVISQRARLMLRNAGDNRMASQMSSTSASGRRIFCSASLIAILSGAFLIASHRAFILPVPRMQPGVRVMLISGSGFSIALVRKSATESLTGHVKCFTSQKHIHSTKSSARSDQSLVSEALANGSCTWTPSNFPRTCSSSLMRARLTFNVSTFSHEINNCERRTLSSCNSCSTGSWSAWTLAVLHC